MNGVSKPGHERKFHVEAGACRCAAPWLYSLRSPSPLAVLAGVTIHMAERDRCADLAAWCRRAPATLFVRGEWLHEQGQIESLRELATLYLFRAFAMHSADYLHIGAITQDISKDCVEKHLADVREKARKICERIAVDRYGALPPMSIYDGS